MLKALALPGCHFLNFTNSLGTVAFLFWSPVAFQVSIDLNLTALPFPLQCTLISEGKLSKVQKCFLEMVREEIMTSTCSLLNVFMDCQCIARTCSVCD